MVLYLLFIYIEKKEIMILVESDEYLFNFSNAHVIIFENQEISVYYTPDNIMKIKGYENVDTSEFEEYFFKYEENPCHP